MDDTLPARFLQQIRRDDARVAVRHRPAGAAEFTTVTWGRIARDVAHATAALLRNGVQPGDRIVQLSENRYEWVVNDLAIQFAQAVHVPIHSTLTGEQIAYQIEHSEAKLGLISTADQVAKLANYRATPCRFFAYDISRDGQATAIGGVPVRSWSAETSAAASDVATDVSLWLMEHALRLASDTLTTILYTSGTTGEPKGVMLVQSNLVSNSQAMANLIRREPEDRQLCFLPLSHIFARTCDMYTWLTCGHELALAQSRDTVVADCQAVAPTLLNGVPYFFDKLRRVIVEQGRETEPGVLRGLLGGRMRICCSGGAALPDHVYEFFIRQGVTLVQGYGMTEASPVIAAANETTHGPGVVGEPISGIEVRIASDGEIVTRGPHVMIGYWKNPVATAETIRDGWLHTGDLGELTAAGCLRITGRKKELLVTSGGKNIAPVMLEGLLTADPLIAQAMVIGDGRNYLTALLAPNLDALRAEYETRNEPFPDSSWPRDPGVIALFTERVRQRLVTVASFEQVRRFVLLERPFTIESGELTAKLSLRRAVIEAHYAAAIAGLYE